MKKYVKPVILEEIIEVEDICAVSNGGATTDGLSDSIFDLFN